MGCCTSSSAKQDPPHHSPPKQPAKEQQHNKSLLVSATSPQAQAIPATVAALEEETVKEVVLSETPISKPPKQIPTSAADSTIINTTTTQIPIFHHEPKTQRVAVFEQEPKSQVPIFKEPKTQAQVFQDQIFTNNKRKKTGIDDRERDQTPEISQASELCSNADTYSTATTNTTTTISITEIRDDHEVTSKRRLVNNAKKSPSKLPRKRPYNPDREALPRRPQALKRDFAGHSRTGIITTQRSTSNAGGSSRVGRDFGERSARRSRSPATRAAAGGVAKGRAGGSPAKVSGKAGGRVDEVGVGSEVKKEERSENDTVLKHEQTQNGNESLDNPLVSLECFIFL